MRERKKNSSNAIEILHKRYIAGDTEERLAMETERLNAKAAQMIYDLRTESNLTQKQLADLLGTTQSVISRLEDADYDGHSLSMLNRIAVKLGKRLHVSLTDNPPK